MFDDSKKIRIVSQYLTPLAVILVIFSIIFSKPVSWALYSSLILLGMSFINNLIIPVFIKTVPLLKNVRIALNVIINTLLIFILGRYWPPLWYLLLLTPVATAVYSNRRNTLLVSISISVLLIGIYLVQGVTSIEHWGHILSRVVLIIFLSLLINSLVEGKNDQNL